MEDIFGYSLYSYWKGDHRTKHTIRRDDENVDEDSLKIYFTNKLYPTEIAVTPLIKGKVLDVGCGVGRHLLRFQKSDLNVIGIDTSSLAIKVCKERGCKNCKVMDIFNPKLPKKSFDTILLFGHNIGIGGTLIGAKKLLKNVRSLSKDNGILLLTTVDVTKTSNPTHKKYHKENIKAGRYIGQMKIRIEYKDKVGKWFNWLHVEPKVLAEIANKTGWELQKIHKGKHGEYSAVLRAS